MRGAVRVAFQCDRRDPDRWRLGKAALEVVICRLTLRESQPPAIVMHDDRDMIGIVERGGRSIEGRIVERPLRRGGLPNLACEFAAVLCITSASALGGKVELIPPLQFRRWR